MVQNIFEAAVIHRPNGAIETRLATASRKVNNLLKIAFVIDREELKKGVLDLWEQNAHASREEMKFALLALLESSQLLKRISKGNMEQSKSGLIKKLKTKSSAKSMKSKSSKLKKKSAKTTSDWDIDLDLVQKNNKIDSKNLLKR